MALIKCEECGHNVSTKAKSCPGCGAAPNKKKKTLVTLTKCEECGHKVSTKTGSCPKCGATLNTKESGCAGCLSILIILYILYIVFGFFSSDSDTKPYYSVRTFGEKCSRDGECESGECKKFVCTTRNKPKVNIGDSCWFDGDCKSDECKQFVCINN